jgi:DnaK suppressor protein
MSKQMPLADRRYAILKNLLQERAQELTLKMRSLRASLPDELAEVKDPEDECVHEFVHALDFALIEMKSRTLSRINEALQRLDEGSYGACLDCEEPISEARLRALPFAERCRGCEERREEIAAEDARKRSRPAPSPEDRAAQYAFRPRSAPGRRPGPERAQPARAVAPAPMALRRPVSGTARPGLRREGAA